MGGLLRVWASWVVCILLTLLAAQSDRLSAFGISKAVVWEREACRGSEGVEGRVAQVF
jgi:hypothetical protein